MAKLVRHLVAHTLGSLKPVVWTWLGVLAFQTWALWMGPDDPSLPPAPGLDLANAGLVLRIVLTVILAAQVVFRQPLVGTTAFWRTRPIPRPALLLSTLATVALVLVVVPFAWFLGVSLWFGLDAGTALPAALIIATEQLIAAGLAIAVASVTKNLAQGVVASIGLTVGASIASWLLLRSVPKRLPNHPRFFVLESGEWIVPIVLTVVGLAASAVSAHQHLTLKTRRTCLLIAVLALLPALPARYPLWSIRSIVAGPPVSSSIAIPELGLDPSSVKWDPFTRTGPSSPQRGIRYTALLQQSGSGADAVTLRPLTLLATLRFDDGIERRFSSDWVELHEEDPAVGSPSQQIQPLTSLATAAGGTSIADPPNSLRRRFRMTFFELHDQTWAFNRLPATALVSVVCEASRYVIAARTPPRVGSRIRTPGMAAEIEGVSRTASELTMTLREVHRGVLGQLREDVFMLHNQRRAEAVVLERIGHTTARSAAGDGGFVVTRVLLSATTSSRPDRAPVLDDDWLANAELLTMQRKDLGRVERDIQVSGQFLELNSAKAGDR